VVVAVVVAFVTRDIVIGRPSLKEMMKVSDGGELSVSRRGLAEGVELPEGRFFKDAAASPHMVLSLKVSAV